MLISYLLRQLGFDLSSVRSSEPSVDLNNTLLKRMEAATRRAAAQQPPDPPVPGTPPVPGPLSGPGSSSLAPGSSLPPDFQTLISSELRAQFQDHQTWVDQRLSQISAEHAAYREEMDSRCQGLRNDLSYMLLIP